MTMPPPGRERRERSPWAPIAYVGSVVAGFGVGAYMHWTLWHPVYDIGEWLLEGACLVVGGLLFLVPRRLPRRIGLMVVLLGVGLIAGQSVGPSRERALLGTATMTIQFERPEPTVVTVRGTCDYVASFDHFAISTGYEGRPATITDQFAITVSFTRGDMWSSGLEVRADGLGLTMSTSPLTDPGPLGVQVSSARSSELAAVVNGPTGTLRFSDLVLDPRLRDQGRPMDFAGSLEWTCTPMQF